MFVLTAGAVDVVPIKRRSCGFKSYVWEKISNSD